MKELVRLGCFDPNAFVRNLVENAIQPDASTVELREVFARLADQWRRERGATSLARRMSEHPGYLSIVAMGEKVVPLILAELERQPDHRFVALHEITGASPVPDHSRAKLNEMAAAWIDWGRKQGYR